ncbi:mitochondrial thiamine pyrophosphate carrier 1 [Metschnikowia bicuspidata var. bicuspidata NRRL YB-4993]|uniref:Mitochondrial thiamine pyrophosphate carrier 1 n=1 Tax=Metschnikowia bicuspidata var. bicuspidata NRRL YB-4993 TaxID=869754 RepID=A0A1A0HG81_9ASCO|nr:mitochondrial thiamine pyrophosphate carrier 1 [Metschnikowia bicuspidata var. bicuspidata NRRL YB-4993]OBA22887.1 mitochondrial thiamine pyrophosphate carrier 1 [Metschnikowia bicuspidata var. bicuspidata NRRL YB-4993]
MQTNPERADHLRKGSSVSPLESLIAGSLSGAVARAVTAPLDTIKIRFQLLLLRDDGVTGIDLVKNLLKKEGFTALWKGNVPAEALYIIYGASQFTTYTILNKCFSDLQNQRKFSLSQLSHLLLVGSGTGMVSTFITYPFDLLRTRLVAHESRVLLSMTDTCKDIYLKNGLKGFFVGIQPTLLSVTASSGLFFWSYSLARDAVDRINNLSPGKIRGVEASCGFIAGVTAKAITFPLDTIRKRMQVSLSGTAHRIFVEHWRSYGFANFYRGFLVSLLKTAPTSAISVAIYEYSISTIRALSSRF